MNYDFLRGYTIPTHTTQGSEPMPQPPPLPTALYGYCDGYDVLGTGGSTTATPAAGEPWNPSPSTQNAAVVSYPPISNRYIPPGKQGTRYRPPNSTPRPAQKRKYNAGPGAKTPQEVPAELTPDGKMAMFHGRDPSYPDELNALIRALNCQLCNVQMNSFHSAKDHFESKAHDRNISGWLARNYTEKGLNPPEVKRFIRQGGPSGPDAFHCELCDLKLTSLTHANQHYAGRKHRLVAGNISKPSGAGFYNSEGKWTRTGTHATPTVDADARFGIGDQFKYETVIAAGKASAVPDTTTSADGEHSVLPLAGPAAVAAGVSAAIDALPDALLNCKVCNISVTSQGQMAMHLEGIKHRKKLKQNGIEVPPLPPKPTVAGVAPIEVAAVVVSAAASNSILESLGDASATAGDVGSEDLSMYRTPTGSYYCKTCNMSMCHVSGLQQHMLGKKHIKKMADEKQAAKK